MSQSLVRQTCCRSATLTEGANKGNAEDEGQRRQGVGDDKGAHRVVAVLAFCAEHLQG